MNLVDSVCVRLSTDLLVKMRRGIDDMIRSSSGSPRVVAHLSTRRDQVDQAIYERGVRYLIFHDETPSAIVCLTCHMKSHHPRDVGEKYCGRCHEFHHNGDTGFEVPHV